MPNPRRMKHGIYKHTYLGYYLLYPESNYFLYLGPFYSGQLCPTEDGEVGLTEYRYNDKSFVKELTFVASNIREFVDKEVLQHLKFVAN